MDYFAEPIHRSLRNVELERERREREPSLALAVQTVKKYQSRRFRCTYRDFLIDPGCAAASQFFLDELYGPHDFSLRDKDFLRIVPALVRHFPGEIVETVSALADLHALSESLDTAMGQSIRMPLGPIEYGNAWCKVRRATDRERQIALTLTVGRDLDRFTRRHWLRHSLKLMRKPAEVAGLGRLQQLLEAGFNAFAAMQGAEAFLEAIGRRERSLARSLFEYGEDSDPEATVARSPLDSLPPADPVMPHETKGPD